MLIGMISNFSIFNFQFSIDLICLTIIPISAHSKTVKSTAKMQKVVMTCEADRLDIAA